MYRFGIFFDAVKFFLKRYIHVFMAAWRVRKNLDVKGFSKDEAEFLPMALALQETPVSPAPRVAMWLLISFVCIALVWAIFGKIDVVATATGRIVPGDRSKVIQSLSRAQVSAIYVRDGQSVRAGDLLIELDATVAAADQERITRELLATQTDVLRCRALLKALEMKQMPRVLSGNESLVISLDAARLQEVQRLATGQYQEYLSKRAQLMAELVRREAELHSTQAVVTRLEKTLLIVRQQASDLKELVGKNFVSRHEWLERERQRLEQEGDLAAQRSRLQEIEASITESRYHQQALRAETWRMVLDLLNESLRRQDGLAQELRKARSGTDSLRLIAPVDGVVQQLAVHTVGGVVTEAQSLMVVVPKDQPLEVEATLENKDIGFVRAKQEAVVKVETFPYVKYGMIPAEVVNVSEDAIQDEKSGLVYRARIRLARAVMDVEGRSVRLSPGMVVTVEIKTAQRRVIEYFLSPLLQHSAESLRER